MWTVYILESEWTSQYYVGCTNSLERRLKEHNSGYSAATKWHRPWRVVYKELFSGQQEAYGREQQIKKYKGGNAFKKLVHP